MGAWAEKLLWGEGRNDSMRALAIPHVIRAAEAANNPARVSLAWELSARNGGGPFAWRKAESSAQGVRRQVLARMLAEEESFRGDVQKSAVTALTGTRLRVRAERSAPEALAGHGARGRPR